MPMLWAQIFIFYHDYLMAPSDKRQATSDKLIATSVGSEIDDGFRAGGCGITWAVG